MTTLIFGKGKSLRIISIKAIIMLEGFSNYTIVHLANKTILSAKHLKYWEGFLPEAFIRVHRKYVVNQQYIITSTPAGITLSNGKEIKYARRRKTFVLKKLNLTE